MRSISVKPSSQKSFTRDSGSATFSSRCGRRAMSSSNAADMWVSLLRRDRLLLLARLGEEAIDLDAAWVAAGLVGIEKGASVGRRAIRQRAMDEEGAEIHDGAGFGFHRDHGVHIEFGFVQLVRAETIEQLAAHAHAVAMAAGRDFEATIFDRCVIEVDQRGHDLVR